MKQYRRQELINDVLSIFFAVEMIFKMIGFGPKGYAKDKYNLFDCMVVIISIVELILKTA